MKHSIEKIIETALNRYIALDPASHARLSALRDKTIEVELSGIELRFQIIFSDAKLQLKTSDFSTPDTIIKGTPISLLHMTLSDDRKRFFADEVSIEGNLDLGQQMMDLFDTLEIDWEEYASHWIGDVSAYQFGRLIQCAKKISQHVRSTLSQNVNDYIHEEIPLFPPREAVLDFFQDVDLLRMDVDRLDARIEKIFQEAQS
ncbi:MAG TPA: SCP2 sterol-binding domain-containing protein [Gammaproteobacteria bacterium]|nr:SCP2 sterol-binding domain-containing protein [Gammaproteobacteria bacterium]